ncbi:MAG: transposase [Phycisphaerales bacterium JB063]
MSNIRLSRELCAVVGEALAGTGSHATLDSLFITSGAPGDPPDLSHTSKWKDWLFRAGNDPSIDSLEVLGNVIEEFMDVRPSDFDAELEWGQKRNRIVDVLEENGMRYYRGGRVLPTDSEYVERPPVSVDGTQREVLCPSDIDDLLLVLVNGLRRAMHPLTHRRKQVPVLSFSTEYDVQDLLHALLRPWIKDVRPEEYTPSYAGSSTRMDFLLPKYELVIEMKFVRNAAHAKKVGDELIIDVEHYRVHPGCRKLLCVVYDPDSCLTNSESLKDIEGSRSKGSEVVEVQVIVV